jgi:hypothetical protein
MHHIAKCEAFCENIRKEDPQSVWRPPEGRNGRTGGFLERDSQELIGLVHGKSIYKWMITRGTPISGNLHIYDINGN